MSDYQKSLLRPLGIIAFLGLFFVFALWRFSPIPAKGLDVEPGEFSSQRAFDLLSTILAEEAPHPTESLANMLVRDRILAQFAAVGYKTEVQRTNNCEYGFCTSVENIIAVLPSETGTENVDQPAVMLVSHYDSVPEGPGVADAGASVAIILETARIMKEEGPYKNPVIFLLTDAEELELNGAAAFVEEHPLAEHVGVVLNFEARGTSGASLMFETSEGDSWLIKEFIKVAPRPNLSSLFFEVYKALPNDTDLTIFKRAGLSGYGFAFIGSVENYHTPNDNLANLDRNTLQHQGENAVALGRHMANADLSQAKGDNFIYTDILSMFVVRYHITMGKVMAIGLLNGLLALVTVCNRRGWTSWRYVGIGAIGALVTLLAPLLLFVVPPDLWEVVPLSRVLITLVVILVTYFVGSFLGKRISVLDVSLGVWMLWTILTLILVFTIPGASIIFFIPAVCAAFIHVLLLWKKETQFTVLILSLFVTAAIWLKLANLFDVALTDEVGQAIITFPLGMLASAVLPTFMTEQA